MTAIFGVLRHIMTAIAGALLTLGYIDEETSSNLIEQTETIVSGVLFISGVAWSVYEKYQLRNES